MQPPTLHANFFSSLKQVEKRLKLESPSPQQRHQSLLQQQNTTATQIQETNKTKTTRNVQNQSLQQHQQRKTLELVQKVDLSRIAETRTCESFQDFSQQQNITDTQTQQSQENQSLQQQKNVDTPTQSLDTPLYLNHPQPTPTPSPTPTLISNYQESETPQEFFSNSIHFSPSQENPCPSNHAQNQERVEPSDVNDDIELLIQLLGLENGDEKAPKRVVGSGCDESFYGKIVGVKGPKSDEQVERLNKWIKHFLNKGGNDGVKQPLRLAHLLLAKAAFVDDFDDGFEFPSTVDEFLTHDPPVVD